MVNYEDKMQLFFSCLLKSKMNLFSIANMVKDKRITNLIDRINETENLIYLICMERGVNIVEVTSSNLVQSTKESVPAGALIFLPK